MVVLEMHGEGRLVYRTYRFTGSQMFRKRSPQRRLFEADDIHGTVIERVQAQFDRHFVSVSSPSEG